MKRLHQLITFSVCIFLMWNIVYPQELTPQKQTQVGVGVTITDIKDLFSLFDGGGGLAPQIFVPINISPKLRLEPGIGFFQSSYEYEDSKSTSRLFSLGVGIFPMTTIGGVSLYYGARLGVTRTSSSYEYSYNGSDSEETSGGGFFIAPTIGAEYFLHNAFTLGAEAQLRYSSVSEEDEYNGEETSSTLSTRTLLFVRFYF